MTGADFLEEVESALRNPDRFVRLTLTDPRPQDSAEWMKIVLRWVRVSSGNALQAVRSGRVKEHSEILSPEEARGRLREWLSMGFQRIHLQCLDRDVHVRITRKGRALVTVGRPSVREKPEPHAHDREKEYPIPAGSGDSFLEAVGIARDGKIIPAMQGKFRQVNQFLVLLSHSDLLRGAPPRPVRIVDCGCGRALLTLAATHYLRDIRGLEVRAVGIDANADVISTAEALRRRVGDADVEFVVSPIREYAPDAPPHIVLSLHACDTATDEALARAVEWNARLVMAAPCCQHELHRQLQRDDLRAILRHGILRERTADIITDALRAAALRVMGYRADVIEFVSPEETAKNLMIRAERARGIGPRGAVEEYLALRDFWRVRPAIERLLGDRLVSRLARAASHDRDASGHEGE